jgi:hypothetical protein
MQKARLEVWAWVLIYGGLFVLTLGLFVGRSLPPTGWSWADTTALVGAVAVALGGVLIVLRSRLS